MVRQFHQSSSIRILKLPGQYKVPSDPNNSEGIHASLEAVTGKRRKSKKGKKSSRKIK